MKLLFVAQEPNNPQYGVPRVIRSIGEQMERRGHTVHYFFEENGPTLCFPRAALMEWSLRVAPLLSRQCQRERYDVIFTTTNTGWCLSTFRRWLLPAKTKIISWHHGWEELKWQQMRLEAEAGTHRLSRATAFYHGLLQWSCRQTLKTQDGCFYTSTEEQEWIRQHYPRHAHKALYLPNGVDGYYYYPERFTDASLEQAHRLLFVGVWDPWRKGRHILSTAFAQLKDRYPELQLSLVGTHVPPDQVLSDFQPEVREAVQITPSADATELADIYRRHDIFLLPSIFEGMPLTVLEAMASALPVVTTQHYGMKDVIIHYDNGMLIPRRDVNALVQSVSHLLETPELCRKLGENAFETVSRCYTWQQIGDIFEENLFRILDNKLPDLHQALTSTEPADT